ncbi:PAN-3 domain-containing protein [Caenorhabditis elegans]|uniref:PAN-3 domain-containing protein n=1 Tax=Caenorhabditis elegans TaxID=6239 RepID=O62156_CAEEL|nr:PAN-3 domain-containing protein [Caenorhabditis elegans]CAB04102.1 PAN-3 domain-containing protein [Caenorhabditis elegans]|eukprot:NP_507659.1 C-type LECtin [Caenorhabditis elegans]
MRLLLIFFYFSTFLFPLSTSDLKMIKIFGYTDILQLQNFENVQSCIDGCFEQPNCLAVHFKSVCSHYFVNNYSVTVVESDRSEEHYVAIKTELPEATCPASYKDIKYSVTSDSGDIYSWKKTDNGWSYRQCNFGWKRFQKTDTLVMCVKVMVDQVTQQVAKEKCIERGAVLARIETPEECKWKQDIVANKYFEKGIWIDGRAASGTRIESCDDKFPELVSYETSAGDCLYTAAFRHSGYFYDII